MSEHGVFIPPVPLSLLSDVKGKCPGGQIESCCLTDYQTLPQLLPAGITFQLMSSCLLVYVVSFQLIKSNHGFFIVLFSCSALILPVYHYG